jgi:hypothetical protein
MKIRLLATIACVAALSACNSNKGNTSGNAAEGANASVATENAAAPAAAEGNSARAVDPQLEQEIARAVQLLRPQLPLRQQTAQGEVKVTNLEASGTELIYTMEVPADLNPGRMAQFQTQVCANPQMRQMLQRGAAYTYRLRDADGEEFSTTISNC